MIKRSVIIWLSIIPLAVLNGFIRESLLVSFISSRAALPLSALTLSLFIFIITYICIPRLIKGAKKDYIKVGIIWLFLTIIFEFLMGIMLGNSLSEILMAYDITTGNLWVVVLLFIAVVPYLVARIKRVI